MTHHSNVSIEWILEASSRLGGEARTARRAALYWRSKGKVYLPICPTANPDGSCSGHKTTESPKEGY